MLHFPHVDLDATIGSVDGRLPSMIPANRKEGDVAGIGVLDLANSMLDVGLGGTLDNGREARRDSRGSGTRLESLEALALGQDILFARVVLANGEAVTASAIQRPDLFGALRGAGHNFGLAISFFVKDYDLPKTQWTVGSLVYTQDKPEDFVEALNNVDNGGDHVPELVLAGTTTSLPGFNTSYPVVAYQTPYLGTAEDAEPYVARFREAGPISVTTAKNLAYRDYYIATNNGYNQATCQKGNNVSGYAASLSRYNTTAMRTVFDVFSHLTADSRYDTSGWLLESYGSRGAGAHDNDTTLLAPLKRQLPVLTVPIAWWAGDRPEAREKAEVYGKLMRNTLAAGDGESADSAHIYLNYAMGGETLDQIYGAQPLPKLQQLKRKCDPMNKFGFYMPLL